MPLAGMTRTHFLAEVGKRLRYSQDEIIRHIFLALDRRGLGFLTADDLEAV